MFCRQTGILDGKLVKIRTIQEVFRQVNTEQVHEGHGGGGEREALRGSISGTRRRRVRACEFLASMVHLALKRHPRPPTPPPSLEPSGSDTTSSSDEEEEDLEMAMLMQSQIMAGASASERPPTPIPHWLPGDSLRKLVLENVRPSMETAFEPGDMVNRTRASREYLGPKEEAIRMRLKEAQTFAGQTKAAKQAKALALRSASSKTNSLTYEPTDRTVPMTKIR